jgi:hypothetical protein
MVLVGLDDCSIRASHLYRLFRPEFIKSFAKPLCSDAFSGFVMADPNASSHNREVDVCSELKLVCVCVCTSKLVYF